MIIYTFYLFISVKICSQQCTLKIQKVKTVQLKQQILKLKQQLPNQSRFEGHFLIFQQILTLEIYAQVGSQL